MVARTQALSTETTRLKSLSFYTSNGDKDNNTVTRRLSLYLEDTHHILCTVLKV